MKRGAYHPRTNLQQKVVEVTLKEHPLVFQISIPKNADKAFIQRAIASVFIENILEKWVTLHGLPNDLLDMERKSADS